MREAEKKRKEKHRAIAEEREVMRQKIREKVRKHVGEQESQNAEFEKKYASINS